MKYYETCKQEAGPEPENVKPFYNYVAYKEGKVFQVNSSDEAKLISKNWERLITNKEEIQASKDAYQEWNTRVQDIWLNALKEDFQCNDRVWTKKDKIFELLYNRAYERGHSCGYDEVSNYFDEEVEHANELFKLLK